MCFELDSVPPIPPISGGAPVRSEDVVLEAADGTRLAAFSAQPDDGARVGDRHPPRRPRAVPLLRGARAPLRRARLRRRRLRLLRPDGGRRRSATTSSRTWSTSRRRRRRRSQQDVARGRRVPALAGRRRAATTVFAVGFCFGGRNAWLATADGHGLAGAVGFYGSTGERNGAPGPTQRAAEFAAPILALQAGDDQNILPEHNAAFDAALTAGGRRARARRVRRRARTASSTAASRTTPTRRPTPGSGRSRSSSGTHPLETAQRSGRGGAVYLPDDPAVPGDPQDEPEAELPASRAHGRDEARPVERRDLALVERCRRAHSDAALLHRDAAVLERDAVDEDLEVILRRRR